MEIKEVKLENLEFGFKSSQKSMPAFSGENVLVSYPQQKEKGALKFLINDGLFEKLKEFEEVNSCLNREVDVFLTAAPSREDGKFFLMFANDLDLAGAKIYRLTKTNTFSSKNLREALQSRLGFEEGEEVKFYFEEMFYSNVGDKKIPTLLLNSDSEEEEPVHKIADDINSPEVTTEELASEEQEEQEEASEEDSQENATESSVETSEEEEWDR